MMTAVIRTTIVTVVLAGLVLLGYREIRTSRLESAMAELEALNQEMSDRLAAHQAMIDRLSRSRRVAHIEVTAQTPDGRGGVASTSLNFIELDEQGAELERQELIIPGDVLFVDAWTVKFDHRDVAIGHPLRGRSMVLLRRIYSDRMAPIDGFAIDTPGAVPPGYAATEMGRFERRIWEDFWLIAGDVDQARARGVRVAQGEAIYKPVKAGRTYELLVDAAGGMNLTPLVQPADDATPLTDADA
jgi:hypothetical protein